MGEVIKDIIRYEDGVCWLTTPAHNSDGGHEMVSPLLDDVKWSGVSCVVA